MSSIQIIEGDLLSFEGVQAIGHGCNVMGAFDAGVAGLIRNKFQAAYIAYEQAHKQNKLYPGGVQAVPTWTPDGKTAGFVYNLMTQVRPGADARPVLITLAVAGMVNHATINRIGPIGLPRIGSGIGGLDWDDDVLPAIETGLMLSLKPTHPITIFVHNPVGR